MPSRYQAALEVKHNIVNYLYTHVDQSNALIRNVINPIIHVEQATDHLTTEEAVRLGLIKLLETADTYFWSDTLVDLISVAANSLPATAVFKLTDLPSQRGFIWLEKPIDLPLDPVTLDETPAERLQLYALSWSTVASNIGALLTVWVRLASLTSNLGILIYPYIIMSLSDTHTVQQIIIQNCDMERIEHSPDVPVTVRIFLSMLAFLQQQLLESREGHADRATQRRLNKEAAKKQHISVAEQPIQVITLRRPVKTHYYDENEDRKHVEWQVRWLVRGHWRNQYYPSDRSHRQIWVYPYQKGPEDKPLKMNEKILAVVR